MEKEYDLKKLQNTILIIAKEVKRICDKNQIDYTIFGGTLIGAVRHKGFIPWDDDIDFVMTRNNYEKFLEVCKYDLKSEFQILNWNTNNYYGDGFTKILLKGTKVVEAGKKNVKYLNAIFVDIFPFDNIPDSIWKQKKQKIITYISIRLLQQKDGSKKMYSSRCKKYIYTIVKGLSFLFTHSFLVRICENNMKKYQNSNTKMLTSIAGYYGYEREKVLSDIFDEYIELPFEDTSFKAIKKYDMYLRQVFGDYMQLPPVEKRRSHGLEYVDFGKY